MNTAVKSLIIPHFITLYSVVKTVMQTQLNTGQIQNKYFLFSVSFVLQQKIEMMAGGLASVHFFHGRLTLWEQCWPLSEWGSFNQQIQLFLFLELSIVIFFCWSLTSPLAL